MNYVVATDVGGTCTDTVVLETGAPVRVGKALSTPPDFANGVIDSIQSAADAMSVTRAELLRDTSLFVHGSTVVDNTLLTRSGSPTGLITTEGFEDTLLVTRGAYGRWAGLPEDGIKHPVMTDRPPAVVNFEQIRGVPERVDYKGAEIRELDESAVEDAVRYLVENKQVAAIGVCLLWSFRNPAHERKIGEIIKRLAPDTYVTLSSDIAPTPGEYERTSTTVINAYAGSIASNYINELQVLLKREGYEGPLLVMQGYGGLLPASEAADRAVGMIECGPAAGVIGAKYLGDTMGDADVIAADMGGTTFKVGVIQASTLEYAREPMVDRYHYVAPKLDVVSIGAGGGSMITLETGTNVPRVGPDSAGAKPGPICYGLGGEQPTLTDVLLLIGYMDPNIFLGGSMTLDVEKTRELFKQKISDPIGMSVEQAAFGIYRLAAAQITDLIHEITVERGLDPRDFVLHAFGGSCPLLASVFGRELNVKRIVVPYTAAVNCAFGLVSADIIHEYAVTTTCSVPTPASEINAIFEPMMTRAKNTLNDEGFDETRSSFDWSIGFRYARQVHEVATPVRASTPLDDAGLKTVVDAFEALYERKYGKGSAYRGAGIEMTQFRLTARGLMERPEIEASDLKGVDPSDAHVGKRDVFVDAEDGFANVDIYNFNQLQPGNRVSGPCVVHTPITTIVIQAAQTAQMDTYRNLIIEFDN